MTEAGVARIAFYTELDLDFNGLNPFVYVVTQHSQYILVPESGDLDCGGGVWNCGTSGGAGMNLSVALSPELGRLGDLALQRGGLELFHER